MLIYLIKKTIHYIKNYGVLKTLIKIFKYIIIQLKSIKIGNFTIFSEYQENIDFSDYKPKAKAIAFYLPQFHTIPENDKWWGKGFTEWTNTCKAKPLFKWHYQPHTPHKDIGYYDLTDINTIKNQAELAKQHGIFGFCFYHYWFSGKRLLEKPLDLFLEHPEIDLNFCLCWANENWTRAWDGLENEVLIKQEYSNDDSYNFIKDIKKYVLDKRYIKIDGKPIILVYNPKIIPNREEVFCKWKNYANEIGIGEIKILLCRTFGYTSVNLNKENYIDGEVEFPPHFIPSITVKKLFNNKTNAKIYDYNEFTAKIKKCKTEETNLPLYRTCMLGWDNTARRNNKALIFAGFSLKSFFEWISFITFKAAETSDPVIFVNAWNEWAEGTYLEPDEKYGYANINTFSKAICGLPFTKNK